MNDNNNKKINSANHNRSNQLNPNNASYNRDVSQMLIQAYKEKFGENSLDTPKKQIKK